MVQDSRREFGARPDEKRDLRAELDRLEKSLEDLKVLYEQYFTGILPLSPDKQHADVKRMIHSLLNAPFRNSELNFRLRTLQNRYHSFDTYFQRVMKQREEGVYSRDVFKANLRERIQKEEEALLTVKGAAEQQMKVLFDSYRSALERATGRQHDLDYSAFQKNLVKRAKELKEKHGYKKLSFKIVVKDGKVTVQAKAKEKAAE